MYLTAYLCALITQRKHKHCEIKCHLSHYVRVAFPYNLTEIKSGLYKYMYVVGN